MTGTGLVCPNGHAAVLPGQRFCETCGAAFMIPAAPPPGLAAPYVAPPPVAASTDPPPLLAALPPAPYVVPPPPPPPVPAGPVPPPPPARRGPSMAVVLGLLLLVAAAGGAAAFVLIAKPFGGGSASPAPSGVAAATPAASATVSPTLPPAATPGPSLEPSPEPTAVPPPTTPAPASPDASALPSGAPTESCRSETVGITVTYPAGWYAFTGDARWTCLLFDPQPIEIVPDSELPPVAVAIFDDTRPASTVAADFETASVYTILATDSGEVDGRPAVAYEVENTGEGYYQKGVRQTVFIVDRGSRGSLVLETTGTAGARYDGNVQVLIQVIDALKID
jgi:hypothetical protein